MKNREKYFSTISYLLIIALCIYIIRPIFQIAVYSYPSADDYSYGLIAREALRNGGGFFALIRAAWKMMASAYVQFSGLYTSNFVNAIHPGVWGEDCYWLTTWIVFGVMFVSTFWSVYILNKHFVKRSLLFVVSAALAIVTMIVLWLPSAWEALYWYNGAMNYIPFAFLNVLNLCILLETNDCLEKRKGKILLSLSAVISFLISGGNHVTSFANILMLLCAFGFTVVKKRFYVLLPLLSACVGFAIMYFSPGTQWRETYFVDLAGKTGVVETILATIRHWIYVVDDWISISWLISMAVVTPMAMEIARKNVNRFSKHFPIIPILMAGAVISGMFCVPYKAMAYFGEGRVSNVIWITFMMLSWFLYVLLWGWLAANEYVNLDRIFEKKHSALIAVLIICTSLFMLFRCHDESMSVSMDAKHELASGIAAAYGQQMEERVSRYLDPSLTEVGVLPIQNPSKLLFGGEFSEDPNEWPNNEIGLWYGGKQIYLIAETQQP